MHNIQTCFAYILLSILLLDSLASAAIEGFKCGSPCRSQTYDINQSIMLQDFAPDGIRGPYNMTLINPMHPGAVISVVTKSETRGSVNLIADAIYIIHIDARIQKNELVLNTNNGLNCCDWRHDGLTLPNPVVKGTKTTTTLVYEAEGFRVFINGKEVAFYTHRSDRAPRVLNLQYEYIYKILYLTTRETRSP